MRDNKGLARWMGRGLFWMGAATLTLAIVLFLKPRLLPLALVFPGIASTGAAVLAVGAQRYRA